MDTNITHENFMNLALEQARIAKENGDLPFGAVIVRDGKVLGTGRAENNTTGDVTDRKSVV